MQGFRFILVCSVPINVEDSELFLIDATILFLGRKNVSNYNMFEIAFGISDTILIDGL